MKPKLSGQVLWPAAACLLAAAVIPVLLPPPPSRRPPRRLPPEAGNALPETPDAAGGAGEPDDELPANAPPPPSRRPRTWSDEGVADRVAAARARGGGRLRARFARAGLAYPPGALFLRVFKQEARLELWATDDPLSRTAYRLVATYPVLRTSGRLGPKRREGDGQVPEGFYQVNRLNPRSLFHLSLGLDYPNAADRRRAADPDHPGSDIFIHGDVRSIGCLAMGDEAIEEIYLAVADAADAAAAAGAGGARRPVPVHVFPCTLDDAGWREVLTPALARRPAAAAAVLAAFWRDELTPGFARFERTRVPPAVGVTAGGCYRIESADD